MTNLKEKIQRLQETANSNKGQVINRRRFLIVAGILVGVVVIYSFFRYARYGLRPKLDLRYHTGRLSEQEMESMLALLEVLIPEDLWPGRDYMVEMVNTVTQNRKGVLKEYKAGLFLLDKLSRNLGGGLRFSEQTVQRREKVLDSLMWRYSGGRRNNRRRYVSKILVYLERVFHFESERRFREFVVRDILKRFYSEHIAWQMAGYKRYPGIPGDPREYVHPGRLPL